MPTGYFLFHMHTIIPRNAVHVLLLTSPVNYSDTGKGRCLNVDNNNLSKPICVIKWMSTRRASDKRYGNPLLLFQQSLCFGGGVGANYSLLPNAPSLESREGKAPNACSLLSTADTDLHSAHPGPDVSMRHTKLHKLQCSNSFSSYQVTTSTSCWIIPPPSLQQWSKQQMGLVCIEHAPITPCLLHFYWLVHMSNEFSKLE